MSAFAITDARGIRVNTISSTPRGAMVNWLLTDRRLLTLDTSQDEPIREAFLGQAGPDTCLVEIDVSIKTEVDAKVCNLT